MSEIVLPAAQDQQAPAAPARSTANFGIVVAGAWLWAAASVWLLTALNHQISASRSLGVNRGLVRRPDAATSPIEVGSTIAGAGATMLTLAAVALTLTWIARRRHLRPPDTSGVWALIWTLAGLAAVTARWYTGAWADAAINQRTALPEGLLAANTPGALATTTLTCLSLTITITAVLLVGRWLLVRSEVTVGELVGRARALRRKGADLTPAT